MCVSCETTKTKDDRTTQSPRATSSQSSPFASPRPQEQASPSIQGTPLQGIAGPSQSPASGSAGPTASPPPPKGGKRINVGGIINIADHITKLEISKRGGLKKLEHFILNNYFTD